MSCAVENDLTAYLDRELPAEAAHRVEAHLSTCEECRRTERLLRHSVSSMQALPAFEPSLGLRRRVLAQVEGLPASSWAGWRSWLRPGRLLPSGVALAAAAAAAVIMVRHADQRRSIELAVATNYELLSDYEVLGLSPDDLEVVEHLDELEGKP